MQRQGTGALTSGPPNISHPSCNALCPTAGSRSHFWPREQSWVPDGRVATPAPPTGSSTYIFQFKHDHRGLFRGGQGQRSDDLAERGAGWERKESIFEGQASWSLSFDQMPFCGPPESDHLLLKCLSPYCVLGWLQRLGGPAFGTHFPTGPTAPGFPLTEPRGVSAPYCRTCPPLHCLVGGFICSSMSPFLLGLPASASVRPQVLDFCPSLERLQALRAGTGSPLWVISKPCLILYLWGRGELLAGALDCPLPLLSLSCYGDGLPLLSLSFPTRREGIPGSQKEPPPAFGHISCSAVLESSSPGSLMRLNLMDLGE